MTTATKPRIDGGNYTAIDSGDGWYILKNIPTLAPVPKGQKRAPQDIGEDWFNSAVKFANESYSKGKIAYPVHLTHTDELGLHNPQFAGYFKPSGVGMMDLPELGNVPVLFSDYKIKADVFKKMESGELGYVSPEVRNWNKNRVSSVALLDSIPPHNAFPLMTIGNVIKDPTAKFEAELPEGIKVARFADGFERVTFDPTEEKKEEAKQEEKPAMPIEKTEQNEQPGKPNAAPIEQANPGKPVNEIKQVVASAKMEADDPKVAARFAAMEDRNAALEKRLNERDALDKSKALEAWALGEMAGYQIGPAAKKSIAKFSQAGESQLKEHVEMLKEVTPKDSPRTFAAAEAASAVAINDPKLAKFAQAGPEKLEAAAKFASEYRTLKSHPAGNGMRTTEEEYVKFQMEQLENPEGTHWGVNVGFGK